MKGVKISGRPLYLDMQATSPVDPRVLDAMLPYYLSRYGNPHSRTHLYGWESEQQEGFDITYLPVKPDGLVDLEKLRASIRPETGLKMNISLMSMSGHKIYGPKGIGALYMRRRPRIRVEPQMNGGGQERGIRSGTVPTPLVVGFGAACELAMKEMDYDEKRIRMLQERLLNGIRKKLEGVVVNGSEESRHAGNLNLSFAFVEGESLLMGLKEVAVSSGSACTSASLEPSYVLRALGVEEDMAHTSIRYGIGRFTTEEEIDRAVELTVNQVEKLREMSPLYEMYKDGIDINSIQWSQH
ncbi:cysteine desulfurase 1 mitochondrial [Phtheirospermum japonicum]|uniref:Cysteine desulfurase 1 mitochondrial n=1 Tax=Phtheirospermum japonicum TaxID=374723 RepID=A0A830C8A5_9LAMI|nr:cysteine desulfurase 1 mitochondrial [Phtheirospermum japonicum]